MDRSTARRVSAIALVLAALAVLVVGGASSGAGEPKLKVRSEPKLALPSAAAAPRAPRSAPKSPKKSG